MRHQRSICQYRQNQGYAYQISRDHSEDRQPTPPHVYRDAQVPVIGQERAFVRQLERDWQHLPGRIQRLVLNVNEDGLRPSVAMFDPLHEHARPSLPESNGLVAHRHQAQAGDHDGRQNQRDYASAEQLPAEAASSEAQFFMPVGCLHARAPSPRGQSSRPGVTCRLDPPLAPPWEGGGWEGVLLLDYRFSASNWSRSFLSAVAVIVLSKSMVSPGWSWRTQPSERVLGAAFDAGGHGLQGAGVRAAGAPVLPVAQARELLAVVLDLHAEAAFAIDHADQHVALGVGLGGRCS